MLGYQPFTTVYLLLRGDDSFQRISNVSVKLREKVKISVAQQNKTFVVYIDNNLTRNFF